MRADGRIWDNSVRISENQGTTQGRLEPADGPDSAALAWEEARAPGTAALKFGGLGTADDGKELPVKNLLRVQHAMRLCSSICVSTGWRAADLPAGPGLRLCMAELTTAASSSTFSPMSIMLAAVGRSPYSNRLSTTPTRCSR